MLMYRYFREDSSSYTNNEIKPLNSKLVQFQHNQRFCAFIFHISKRYCSKNF